MYFTSLISSLKKPFILSLKVSFQISNLLVSSCIAILLIFNWFNSVIKRFILSNQDRNCLSSLQTTNIDHFNNIHVEMKDYTEDERNKWKTQIIDWFSFTGTISCCSLRKLGRLYILQWEIPKGRIRIIGIIRRKNPKQCNSVFQSSQYCGSLSWEAVLYSWTSICDCSQRYNYWKGNHHKKSFDGNRLWSCVQHT